MAADDRRQGTVGDYARVFMALPLAAVVWDEERKIVDWNDQATTLFGWQRDEVIGRALFELLLPEDIRPHIDAVLESISSSDCARIDNVDKGRNRLTCEWSTSHIRDASGEIVAEVSLIHGTSARDPGSGPTDLFQERARQSQRMMAIGTFGGEIAHDLNNMISAIMNLASTVQKDVATDHPLQQDVDAILAACEKGHELTRKLRTFTGKGQGKKRVAISLNHSVGVVRSLLRRAIPEKISIEEHLEPNLDLFEGDPGQISEALINLAINAADAMRGEGQLTFTTKNIEVSNAALLHPDLRAGHYVVLQVKDTGVGMDAETRQRAFEPFFTTKEHGAGLGLSKVYGIVRSLRGTVILDSSPGKGTVVSLYLPTADFRGEDSQPGAAPEMVTGTGTIMVVDDEALVRMSGQRLLARLGYTVILAEDGRSAIEQYEQRKDEIDLVILDLVMPQMSGEEALQRLREINPKVRVLAASGYPKEEIAEKLYTLGVEAYVAKPFDIAQLSVKLASLLNTPSP